ncbi:MAG: hypothetical protein GX456_12525 [Verrucomicrobia bacterium]|nr:hypothetical protein [Verrucomicrobiota bacterium]
MRCTREPDRKPKRPNDAALRMRSVVSIIVLLTNTILLNDAHTLLTPLPQFKAKISILRCIGDPFGNTQADSLAG